MKSYLSLFFIVFCTIVAYSQAQDGTYIGQHIERNTTWTKAGSPYIITLDLIIQKGAILTIEGGVEVLFSRETRMIVDGGIRAEGSKSKKITFSGLNDGSWNGFLLLHTCEAYEPETEEGTLFRHCIFKGTGDAPSHLIRTKGCDLQVADSYIEDCYIGIHSERQAYIYVESNYFKYCDRPINVQNTSQAKVTNNTMIACNSVLLGGTTLFEGNTLKKFTDLGRHSGVIVWMLGGGIVTIKNNRFVKFEDVAVKLQRMSHRSSWSLEENDFKHNGVNLKLSCKYYNYGKSSIINNNFYNYNQYHVRLFDICLDDETNNVVEIGANYWGKLSEDEMNKATLDMTNDPKLTGEVEYTSLLSKTIR